MQIVKDSDQFENLVFVILGNWGEYTPYLYIPLNDFSFSKSPCPTLHQIFLNIQAPTDRSGGKQCRPRSDTEVSSGSSLFICRSF